MTLDALTDRPGALRIAVSAVGTITSQVAVATAVLYYFGLMYTRAWYGYFGIDASMLGLSTADYLYRSLYGGYWPAVLLLLLVSVLYTGRRVPVVVAAWSRRPRLVLRVWAAAIFTVGAVLQVLVAVGILIRGRLPAAMSLYLPIMLVLGAALVGYVIALRAQYPVQLAARSRAAPPIWVPLLAIVLLICLGMLWAVGVYAQRRASADAAIAEARRFADRPVVLLFSVDRLGIEGGGSQMGEITAAGEKYRYVYSGLLLLARTPDRYFLLPHDWKPKRDRVFVVNSGDGVRIDLAPHP
ncbi:hypothetical protein NDR87_32770 [Nocardia sp. CDC159]|uniref:Uncharacterized protein n=1 Tax=Nocardia pulmonis TaxID=2951408 RepID=A0A9X2IZM9_9NOCA|nr:MULTISPECIES: hypothetical protein [Nocardia]MCM6778267.1 hypothetical protein [Nocardia pulmonis]MCM6791156.1 hypothetical protein [Nocardia sp. CDC159]